MENKLSLIEFYFQESKNIDFEKVNKAVENNIKRIKRYLKKQNLDPKIIEKYAKSASENVYKRMQALLKTDQNLDLNNKILIKNIGSIITEEGLKSYKRLNANLKAKVDNFKNIKVSFTILYILLFSQFILMILTRALTLAFGPIGDTLYSYIYSVIVAPLTEEYAKRVSIEKNIPWLYTGIFAGFEFLSSIMISVNPIYVALRAAVVLMHLTTTFIQKKFMNISDKSIDPKKMKTLGFVFAVLIHGLWNLLATIYQSDIKNFIMGG